MKTAFPLPDAPELQFSLLDRSSATLQRFATEPALGLDRPLPLRGQPQREPWMLFRKADHCLLGLAWGVLTEAPRTLGFYLWIAPPFRGQGWASEAGRALLRVAFADGACQRVETACRMVDPAAAGLIEKLQMLPEGVQRQAWCDPEGCHDIAHFGLLASDPGATIDR